MKLNSIISPRRFLTWPSWHLVYEWEDVFSDVLDVPLKCESRLRSRIRRLANRIGVPTMSSGHELVFVMGATTDMGKDLNGRTVPFIVDYFLPDSDYDAFAGALGAVDMVLISSRQVYDYIKDKGGCGTRFEHLPLSLPDKYMIAEDTVFNKEYDLVMLGRPSPIFKDFLDEYLRKHPAVSVLDRKIENGHFNFYSPSGELVGNADTRESYMELMRKSRVMLYSIPGIDGDRETNGFHPVTPRFLESIACGCNLLLRYEENSDTDFYELASFGKSIETYDDFEAAFDKALASPADMDVYSRYLRKHYTSVRAEKLRKCLEI